MRLLYACSELGLGHASRTIALGKRLQKRGHEIHFYTGGRAYELLKEEFEHVHYATPVAWYENSNGVVTTASLINILVPLPYFDTEQERFHIKNSSAMETIRRYHDLRRDIYRTKPEAVLADGDINALRLAQRWKLPNVYITNVVRPSYGFSSVLNPGERVTEIYVKSCTKIVVPDNLPPFTICDYNIGNLKTVGVENKTEFVGSFFDTAPTEVSDKHVFAPISGPFGTRSRLLKMLLPTFKELSLKAIISLGLPGDRKTATIGNCTISTWLSTEERREAMRNASVVVYSGGHITSFETVKYAKPTVCIPTQPEQLANAAKLQDLGCSNVAKNRKQLVAALREIKTHHDRFKRNAEALNRASNKQNGLNRAAEIVEELNLH